MLKKRNESIAEENTRLGGIIDEKMKENSEKDREMQVLNEKNTKGLEEIKNLNKFYKQF